MRERGSMPWLPLAVLFLLTGTPGRGAGYLPMVGPVAMRFHGQTRAAQVRAEVAARHALLLQEVREGELAAQAAPGLASPSSALSSPGSPGMAADSGGLSSQEVSDPAGTAAMVPEAVPVNLAASTPSRARGDSSRSASAADAVPPRARAIDREIQELFSPDEVADPGVPAARWIGGAFIPPQAVDATMPSRATYRIIP